MGLSSRRGLAPALLSGARAVPVLFRRALPPPGLWPLTVCPSAAVRTALLCSPVRAAGVPTTAPCTVNPPRSCPKQSPNASGPLARAVPAAVFVTESPVAAGQRRPSPLAPRGKAPAFAGSCGGEGRG
ncbi:arabinogalactan protein 1-like [Camarhynchus parvulus]|uniref:arabinogalactan protein 1-like n=1 Tax=Geospiza parvula TaxID=87175 RepID=UPI001237F259|nr:arabinogalactan protein 1-like [Camarhynchus parvulus]